MPIIYTQLPDFSTFNFFSRIMEIAAYYFPNWHRDARNEAFHGPGWTEWELMKCSRPRFEGHRQPRVPMWGYEDEADPQVMAKKIDAAADHGLDAFVFDWYWYDGPYLQRALDEGFLQAPNRGRLKFALMWANHDWMDRHPIGYSKSAAADLLYKCSYTPENIGSVWDYVIKNYLTRPEYWRVDGKPYFSIYNVNNFIKQMGGTEGATAVLADFRARAQAAGLPGVHLNAIWYDNLELQPFCVCMQRHWHERIGFDSYTSYNSACTTPAWEKPAGLMVDFADAAREYVSLAEKALAELPAPYYPVVTAGWDCSPRTIPSEPYRVGPYPYLPIMDSDAQAFGEELAALSQLLAGRPESQQLIFINAWNEWSEGSYLEPDTDLKYSMLEALKKFRNP